MIASPNNKVEEELYMEKSICPLCHNKILKSEYMQVLYGRPMFMVVIWLAEVWKAMKQLTLTKMAMN